jgi:hypothetical protein
MNRTTAEQFDPFTPGLSFPTGDPEELHAFIAYDLAWRVLSEALTAENVRQLRDEILRSEVPEEGRTFRMIVEFRNAILGGATSETKRTMRRLVAAQALCELENARRAYLSIAEPDADVPSRMSTAYRAILNALAAGYWSAWGQEGDIHALQIDKYTNLPRERGKMARNKPKPQKRTPLHRGLEQLVAEGLDNPAVFALLGDVDAISSKARAGFPFELVDDSASVVDDGFVLWYPAGGSADLAKNTSVKRIKNLLSLIRNPRRNPD